MHADPLPLLGGESRQREIIQINEAVKQFSGGIDLDRQPALREIDLNLMGAFFQTAPYLGFVLAQQIVDELLSRVTGNFLRPDT